MILSNRAGSRFQMDLIKMPPCRGYTQILRVVDHLSKYGYVAPMKSKSATECADALVRILSRSIMPKILQSDNGGEVCIYVLPSNVACIIRFSLLIYFRLSFLFIRFFYSTNSVNFPRLYGFCYATNSGNAFELQHFFICNCSFSSLAHVLRQLTNIFLGCI